MGDITNEDYAHAKGVCKEFQIENLPEYHDLFKGIQYYQLMYLRTFEICVLKYINLIKLVFFQLWIRMTSSFKKTKSRSFN